MTRDLPPHVVAQLDQHHAGVAEKLADLARLVRLHKATGCKEPLCYGHPVSLQLQAMTDLERTGLLTLALIEFAKPGDAPPAEPTNRKDPAP